MKFLRKSKHYLFFKGLVRDFHHTGAIAPSSKGLAETITGKISGNGNRRLHILEVGAGTGAFTERILTKLPAQGHLDIYECNPKFTQVLREKTKKRKGAIQIYEDYIQNLDKKDYYSYIVCGLPFNNFSPELTEEIFSILYNALQEGGTLSFFEYFAIRRIKGVFCCEKENKRLRRIHQTLKRVRSHYEVEKRIIWRNIPPAVVWHLKKQTE